MMPTALILAALPLVSSSLLFTAFGDWGGRSEPPYTTPSQIASAKGMAESPLVQNSKFILALGDNFYSDGVDRNNAFRFRDTFENVYDLRQPAYDKPWYVIPGNHDYRGNVSLQIAYSAKNAHWHFPHRYHLVQDAFTADDGSRISVDIVMMDTVMLVGSWDDTPQPLYEPALTAGADEQWQWIEETMAKSTADWLLVAGHYPIFSVAEHGPTRDLVQRLWPLMQKHGAAMYMCGHEHNAQFLRAGDVDMVVTGAIHKVERSDAHAGDVPRGALKYFFPKDEPRDDWAMFTVMNVLDQKTLNTSFIDQAGDLKQVFMTLNPRAMH